MTNKDIEITTTAVLKSVIESGAPVKDWEELTKAGIHIYASVSNAWKEGINNGK